MSMLRAFLLSSILLATPAWACSDKAPDGSDLCAMAADAAKQVALRLPVDMIGVRLVRVSVKGSVVGLHTVPTDVARTKRPHTVLELACTDPNLARLLASGGVVAVLVSDQPTLVITSCEAP